MLCPNTQAELVDLSTQLQQKPSEPLPTWLLRLWDLGLEDIILSESEIGKLASLMTHPFV